MGCPSKLLVASWDKELECLSFIYAIVNDTLKQLVRDKKHMGVTELTFMLAQRDINHETPKCESAAKASVNPKFFAEDAFSRCVGEVTIGEFRLIESDGECDWIAWVGTQVKRIATLVSTRSFTL